MNEFMETAVAVELEEKPLFRSSKPISNSSSSESKEKVKMGGLCQYASMGGGKFTPTSDTIKALPADCYTVGFTPDGQLVMHAQRLVTDNLLRLPDSKSDAVVSEVNRFWELKSKFKKYGFAHKRGFLLWGPPGSGKSSTVAIIIQDMIKAGGIVFLADHPAVLAMALKSFRAVEPDRPLVVVMEDLDTIIYNYGESQVLSILDGEHQVENVVYIATTNYPEKLDGRIINRPSRFDRIVKIGMPNDDARRIYLQSKLETTEMEGVDLVKATDGFSIAHIKELIISVCCQEVGVNETLDRLRGMKKRTASDSELSPIGIG